jgi:tetratricopeptide (TPR) repeat protein
MAPSERTYKVKLESGRVLGPLDLHRVRLLILKDQIQGSEQVRIVPSDEWIHISLIPEIADLLIQHAQGLLSDTQTLKNSGSATAATVPLVLPGTTNAQAATVKLTSIPENKPENQDEPPTTVPLPSGAEDISMGIFGKRSSKKDMSSKGTKKRKEKKKKPEPEEVSEKTIIGYEDEADEEKTEMHSLEMAERQESESEFETDQSVSEYDESQYDSDYDSDPTTVTRDERKFGGLQLSRKQPPRKISQEETIIFQGKRGVDSLIRKKKGGFKAFLRATIIAGALGYFGYDTFLATPSLQNNVIVRPQVIRPKLPQFSNVKTDSAKSQQAYVEAMRYYLRDTVTGYKFAEGKLHEAVSYDSSNVKALAMLASTYLNLIDSSNKDEKYFSTISKLIELSRGKALDLPETVIADVEYYITANKPEAAQSRVIEYSRTHQNFAENAPEMFYYIALAYFHRGDSRTAARYLAEYPEQLVRTPKVFYLRGLIAEKLGDTDLAIKQFNKALRLYDHHAKSHLKIADLFYKSGNIKEAQFHLNFMIGKPENAHLLAPKDLAHAYYLDAIYSEQGQNFSQALFDLERAIKLDGKNHEYLLEYYTLRARAGDKSEDLRNEAKMYYFLGEGERQLREGKQNDALTQFLQARKSNPNSPVPLIKTGDMFRYFNDLGNARLNYKKAAEMAPKNIEVWSKYIAVLIQSYEWDEAQAAMDRFRKLPVPQSAIDKAAADLYEKQGRSTEAQFYYRNAMSREVIDPDVYIAYAKSLMNTGNFQDAPFFFALALRLDPLNVEAVIGTAKSIAASESVDRAVSMLSDELKKGTSSKAELLAAIAEFQIQKGSVEQAKQNLDQAMAVNPDYAYPWKLMAKIYMAKEGTDKAALDKALAAYKSYSDRNASDPSGYLERYRIYIRRMEFDKAAEELDKIFGVYPKYPNLHYYKGALYGIMGNQKAAVEEYQIELKNNPQNVNTMVALGKTYVEVGMVQESLNEFVKAMQIAPQSSEAKHQAGYANYLLKNYSAAVALYVAAAAIDKGNPLIYKRLGLAYQALGDGQNAAINFRKYIEMEPDAQDRAQIERFL